MVCAIFIIETPHSVTHSNSASPHQVLTTFDLPDVEDMWTLVGKVDERRRRETGLLDHSFLILSRTDSSLILRTEEEINELEESGFNTTSKTVFAGNMGNNRYIVQVG